jgi:hypothetical protein
MLGLKSLINNGIEVFPSLLVNSIPPVKLKFLFNDLLEIHPKLPLRVMIRRVLPYAPIVRRMEDLKINLYSFDECLQHWKQLIAKNYGTEYLKVERWKIKL